MYLHYIILAALILCFAAVCLGEAAYKRRILCRKYSKPDPSAKKPSRKIAMLSPDQLKRILSIRCPHCKNLLSISHVYDCTDDVPKKGYLVYCCRCGFVFPMAGTEKEAIACAEEISRNWDRTDGYNPMFSCIDHGDSVTMIYNGKEDTANGTLHE